ncbi:hypothetical protein SAMN04488498_12746 [Mesorhizobium albiziae]|uniref:Uncharacterized protein n=1 Tax=Neomesorhizobium albiziae TaxID=335020 RepID=A0A1I4ENP5_9HYPH|nr:hypothetical protein [Mesorhizobium albiziae]GLS34400.1 hypothetical protein GCM10007937_61150 [Mesorhizobium albiziae]SFL06127.1 hypothetical protein SAMN04488498_12746 [Mesorhizobium albiziae]
MTIPELVVRKISADRYVVEMTNELGSIAVYVSLAKIYDDREYSEAERETLACLRAQELALDFAEAAESKSTLS